MPPIISRLFIFAITGATLAIAVYVFILTGGPLLRGVDRVTFWREMAPLGTSLLPNIVNQSFFFAAFYFLWRRRTGGSMLVPSLIVGGYTLTALLILGQKFSIFIIFLNAWLLILPGIFPLFKLQIKNIIFILFFIIIIISYVAFTYISNEKDLFFIITRIALQAQLLWSVFNDPEIAILWPSKSNCYFGCNHFSGGIDYITYRYLPESLYEFYSQGGTVLSGFMPALSILTFGAIISLLLHIIISFILGITQNKIVTSSRKIEIIYAFLLFRLHLSLTMIWFAAMNTALFGILFTLLILIIYRIAFMK